jgi:flagellar motor switch protein FliN
MTADKKPEFATFDSGEEIVDAITAAARDAADGKPVDAVMNVRLTLRAVLGRSTMTVGQLLKMTRGTVIALDRKIGDPVTIELNGSEIVLGDLVQMEDGLLAVRTTRKIQEFLEGKA